MGQLQSTPSKTRHCERIVQEVGGFYPVLVPFHLDLTGLAFKFDHGPGNVMDIQGLSPNGLSLTLLKGQSDHLLGEEGIARQIQLVNQGLCLLHGLGRIVGSCRPTEPASKVAVTDVEIALIEFVPFPVFGHIGGVSHCDHLGGK